MTRPEVYIGIKPAPLDAVMSPEFEREERALRAVYSAAPKLLDAALEAMIAMGKEGANSDLSHPLRLAWEMCRQAIGDARDASF